MERIVAFHKALADPTRINILRLLASELLHGQALAEKLGLTPPNISHHMKILREAGLIKERKVPKKNMIYFHLDAESLEKNMRDTVRAILHQEPIEKQHDKLIDIYEKICAELTAGEKYTEREINEHIKRYTDDFATVRRELVARGYLYRESGFYELADHSTYKSQQERRISRK